MCWCVGKPFDLDFGLCAWAKLFNNKAVYLKVVRQIYTIANNTQMTIGPAEGFSTYNPLLTIRCVVIVLGHLFSLRILVRCGIEDNLYLSVLDGTAFSLVGLGLAALVFGLT